jgi:transcription elongation factor GreB
MSEQRFISQRGAQAMQAEADQLYRVERPRVVNQVAAAAAEGDRSENAEYIYGKKRLREIDKRLQFLGKLLEDMVIIEPPRTTEKIGLLSWVVIEDEEGKRRAVRIVGQDETDARAGHISWRSPVGRALLNKRVDDVVNVTTPGGQVEYTVAEIHLTEPKLEP